MGPNLFYILCQQQILHLSTVFLMKWLAFTVWNKHRTNWWDLLPDHRGTFDKWGWPKQLWSQCSHLPRGASPGRRTHVVHTQSWAWLKNLKIYQHRLAVPPPHCLCSSPGQTWTTCFLRQLYDLQSVNAQLCLDFTVTWTTSVSSRLLTLAGPSEFWWTRVS